MYTRFYWKASDKKEFGRGTSRLEDRIFLPHDRTSKLSILFVVFYFLYFWVFGFLFLFFLFLRFDCQLLIL